MQEQNFQVGDKAVYPGQGVVEVTAVETKNIAGTNQAFYVLKPMGIPRTIMVPVRNADAVGLRAPISDAEVDAIFETLGDHSKTLFEGETWHKRYRGYQDLIKTGDIQNIARVLRDLLLVKGGGSQLSFGERRTLESVRSMVAQEVAVSRGVSEDEIVEEIQALFATAA